MVLDIDGSLWTITYFQHVKPGKGGAFVRTKMKNLLNGKTVDKTFRAGEKVDEADVEDRTMQYLYMDGESLVFMDTSSYDQLPIAASQVGDDVKYLKENTDVDVLFWKGKPTNVTIPAFLEAVISQCDPGLKGDTASNTTKPATLETGAVIQVPLFIKEGETVRVDTRTRAYVERVG